MNKKILGIVLALVAVTAGYLLVTSKKDPSLMTGKDYKNISYEIDGQLVALKNGEAHYIASDDSAPRAIVRYFGNGVSGDFNGDGLIDETFLLTQDNGGSGTFYYVVAALNMDEGYRGTNAIFLGDRIAPQTTEFHNGEIIVNYAVRRPEEVMTARPSVGVSRYLKIEGNRLVEIKK